MGKLTPQRFTVESFREQANWIGNLFSPLNSFINDVVLNFNNQLTVSDNLFQEIKEITFKNSSGNFPLVFKTKFNTNPKGMQVIYIYDNTLSKCATQFPVVEWKFENGDIKITAITGLTASTSYTVRFLVIYG